jgi:hypothetical protein
MSGYFILNFLVNLTMSKNLGTKRFTDILKGRFQKEMPKIRKEIALYETHLKEGKLNTTPKIAPQFNS